MATLVANMQNTLNRTQLGNLHLLTNSMHNLHTEDNQSQEDKEIITHEVFYILYRS